MPLSLHGGQVSYTDATAVHQMAAVFFSSLVLGMCRIIFLHFGLVYEKTRIQLGMSLVWFEKNTVWFQ